MTNQILLNELREKIGVYAQHGGAWGYIASKLNTICSESGLISLVIDEIQNASLGSKNRRCAYLLFDALAECILRNDFSSYKDFKLLGGETARDWCFHHMNRWKNIQQDVCERKLHISLK